MGAYIIGFDHYEWNPEGLCYDDLTSLELIQEGLMKALLDIQRRIIEQARKEA